MLVTPRCSVRSVMPSTHTANHKKVRDRENAGRSNSRVFHQSRHSCKGRFSHSCSIPNSLKVLVSLNKEKIVQIERRVAEIKRELSELGPMRPGSMSVQYKDPASQSGAFNQLSFTHGARSKTEFIRAEFVDDILMQTANYKKFKELSVEWISLSIEHSRLTMGHKSSSQVVVRAAQKSGRDRRRTRHS